MSYWDQSLLAADGDFAARVTACFAVEYPTEGSPAQWALDHAQQMAAQPGFAAAYSSALAAGVPNPGRREEVISDGQILSAVHAVHDADTGGA